ncbi:hypothetical protein MAPG_06113 [Magnaporthiopsis poae ATCC 64411]|uniref:Ras guanine nucleotide exchange factor A n=1 Tax=Magnaporthiopsis poae (strain ATCC 64411 / 73-15) TaxID=644358 RepID=A0A0C4E164_MAGP6|nr:hypothetical protein MAPG_06113 [Magnaporthiopsis poae ATCC 64411]
MVMLDGHSMRASLQVAPLAIHKTSRSATSQDDDATSPTTRSDHRSAAAAALESAATASPSTNPNPNLRTTTTADTVDSRSATSHMTPPATPNGSQEDLLAAVSPPPVFHNFLRAFFQFQPTYTMSDSTVTLPLNEGDVVLVHSIHTNGWADGTLLVSGARGWLPTNYCEAYDPDEMRNLLKALLNFWDLLRSTAVNDSEIFGNQEFMKGIIAGVRYLLERTHCLTRESALIQRHEGLRRSRKSLLSELSSLVKTAKRLQEHQRRPDPNEDVNDIVDEMILKAFKIVTKGTRFLDILEDDRRSRAPAVTVMATVLEESTVPPTPPADSGSFEPQQGLALQASDAASRAHDLDETRSRLEGRPNEQTGAAPSTIDEAQQTSLAPANANNNTRRQSIALTPASCTNPRRLSQNNSTLANRLSSTISHRVSLAGPSPLSRPHNLVSQRLSDGHDTFLSYLGSFIGRLHLQSQSRPHLALAIKQSATSGGELLVVIDVVCAHNHLSLDLLELHRAAMYDRLRDLVLTARDVLTAHGPDDEDIMVPHDNSRLLYTATDCVRATGECVAKTKWLIERIGDFEFEFEEGASGLDMDLTFLEIAAADDCDRRPSTAIPLRSARSSFAESQVSEEASLPALPAATTPTPTVRPTHPAIDKPLPEVPQLSPSEDNEEEQGQEQGKEQEQEQDKAHPQAPPQPQPQPSPPASRPTSLTDDAASSMASSMVSLRPVLPPLPKLSTSLLTQDEYSPSEHSAGVDSEYHSSFRSESITTASSTGTGSTYLSRDSESSLVSQTSTRATTPDLALASKTSLSDLSNPVTGAEEVEDVESKLLEKTFAHELMFNKEGQVTGGSLPALVERLTTHESTPDAMFVSTFYLTFRLFCTPVELAESLVERFDYVAESPHMAIPVRMRVYNAFKGWMESHWRHETDQEALAIIEPFANFKLSTVLPTAATNLFKLTQRVSSDDVLVPRLASSMNKTNAAIAGYIPPDTPLPPPILTKSQAHALANWKNGGSCPTILDFDPQEFARQLTLKQMGHFCSVMPEELLGSQWMKKGGIGAPNVKAMSGLSTDLSNLVADTILHYSEVKKRATVIKHWIKIAHQCLELNNYDALMAIICSLNSSTITRLRRTWEFVSARRRELLKQMQAVVEPSQNNKVLRGRLHDHVPPCLPFLGMFLTDLTFVDIGNPATKQLNGSDGGSEGGNGLTVVNFDKHTRTAKIIGELQRFQIPYRLAEVPDMQEWLQAQIVRVRELEVPGSNVQVSYYRKSLLLEPRETTQQAPRAPSGSLSAGGAGSTGGSGLLSVVTAGAVGGSVSAATTPVAKDPPTKTDYFGWMRGASSSNTTLA